MKRFLPVPRMICLLSLTSALLFFTCNEEPTIPPAIPTPTKPTIRLEVQFEDFTEVLLKVTVSDTSKWKYVTIHRDGKLVHFESFLSKDTVITDAGLESNTIYSYQASLIENGRASSKRRVLLPPHRERTEAHAQYDARKVIRKINPF